MKLNKAIIIAEVGINHNGSISKAKQIIKNSVLAGADFVKFQLYKTDELAIADTPLAKYQKKNNLSVNQFALLKKYEINENFIKKIKAFCHLNKIKMLVTPFDITSLKILIKNRFRIIKISSTDLNNHQLLDYVSRFNLKVFMSTGMSDKQEIKQAIKILTKGKIKLKNIVLLQCTTSYPAKIEEANLKSMVNFKNLFKTDFGYSDHTAGNTASLVAVALGAKVIEKHVTLNRESLGPDHKSSLEKNEFIKFVRKIRDVEVSMGGINKKITKSEILNSKVIRKSIVATQKISKGDFFSIKNISCKRPNLGLSASNWHKVIGKKAQFNFRKDDFIKIK